MTAHQDHRMAEPPEIWTYGIWGSSSLCEHQQGWSQIFLFLFFPYTQEHCMTLLPLKLRAAMRLALPDELQTEEIHVTLDRSLTGWWTISWISFPCLCSSGASIGLSSHATSMCKTFLGDLWWTGHVWSKINSYWVKPLRCGGLFPQQNLAHPQ